MVFICVKCNKVGARLWPGMNEPLCSDCKSDSSKGLGVQEECNIRCCLNLCKDECLECLEAAKSPGEIEENDW